MLTKLQRKTLVPTQVIGYAITLFIGVLIVLTTVQLYLDVKPLLSQQSEVFKSNHAVVSKEVSIFKTMDKERIYFTDDELEELKNQPFVKEIATFNTATFKIKGFAEGVAGMSGFYADMFFESIPDKYVDLETDDWKWNAEEKFIPIIIPEDYLNLYNFGFAESQNLPVLSKTVISQIEYKIRLSGNGLTDDFRSRIVGFSSKINSILVPQKFLEWANSKYGNANQKRKASRVLIEFSDPSDERILEYFNDNNYAINKDKLEFSKLMFFFKSALLFVFAVAVIIIILSISFILLSINLIIQKNKDLFLNLYSIGYSYLSIAKFYRITVSIVTFISIVVAAIISYIIRGIYLQKFMNLLQVENTAGSIFIISALTLVVLVVLYNLLLVRNIKKVVTPKK